MLHCDCGYTSERRTNLKRHRESCCKWRDVEIVRMQPFARENARLRLEIQRLCEENRRLVELIKGANIRPKMTQNRRLRLAAAQNWMCKACESTLSEAFHVDHIRPWSTSFDDSDANLCARFSFFFPRLPSDVFCVCFAGKFSACRVISPRRASRIRGRKT